VLDRIGFSFGLTFGATHVLFNGNAEALIDT
jgi:hypothetical protein